jgi:predicted RNase H-like nuclease
VKEAVAAVVAQHAPHIVPSHTGQQQEQQQQDPPQ